MPDIRVPRIQRFLILASVTITILSAIASSLVGKAWPTVRPLEQTFDFPDAGKGLAKTFVLDAAGRHLYLFICRRGDDASGPGNILYSGTLDCRLMEARRGEREENLFLETPNIAAWYSRGRMFDDELYGACGDYPEYGRIRHFYLRGMSITLSFDNAQFAPARGSAVPRLVSYVLKLKVVPDPKAIRDIAASSGYLDPRKKEGTRSCQTVRKGTEWK